MAAVAGVYDYKYTFLKYTFSNFKKVYLESYAPAAAAMLRILNIVRVIDEQQLKSSFFYI